MPNPSTPVTFNRNYPKPGNPYLNEYPFSQNKVNDAIDAIDLDVEGIDDRLTATEDDVSDIEVAASTESNARADGDKKLQNTAVFSSATYDGEDRLTDYTTGNVVVSDIVYDVEDKITSWTETTTLSSGTEVRNYTATYDGSDRITAVSYVVA